MLSQLAISSFERFVRSAAPEGVFCHWRKVDCNLSIYKENEKSRKISQNIMPPTTNPNTKFITFKFQPTHYRFNRSEKTQIDYGISSIVHIIKSITIKIETPEG